MRAYSSPCSARVSRPRRLSDRRSPARREGFTLVELLTVVVIIGILVSLITAAALRARVTARNAVIVAEISDLSTALQMYATEVGELPPDFTDQQRVLNHLRKRFPRYQLPAGGEWAKFKLDVSNGTGGLNVDQLDPSTALVFWLAGIPDGTGDSLPKGFSANAYNPFQTGGSRTKQYRELDPRRLPDRGAALCRQYHPQYCSGVPYVYFRARKDLSTQQWTYTGLFYNAGGTAGVAVPYVDASGNWCEQEKFQIIAAGTDGNFGTGTTARSMSGSGCTPADYDNITNFSQGILQEKM